MYLLLMVKFYLFNGEIYNYIELKQEFTDVTFLEIVLVSSRFKQILIVK